MGSHSSLNVLIFLYYYYWRYYWEQVLPGQPFCQGQAPVAVVKCFCFISIINIIYYWQPVQQLQRIIKRQLYKKCQDLNVLLAYGQSVWCLCVNTHKHTHTHTHTHPDGVIHFQMRHTWLINFYAAAHLSWFGLQKGAGNCRKMSMASSGQRFGPIIGQQQQAYNPAHSSVSTTECNGASVHYWPYSTPTLSYFRPKVSYYMSNMQKIKLMQ